MKYLVTGANGYIGTHIVSRLLDDGHEVYAADVQFTNVDKRAICIELDIFQPAENVYEICKEPDVCIHLAWRNGFVHGDDSHIDDLPHHYHFLKNMMKSGLKQLVVMGSMHEVGYWEGPIDENTPTNPMSLYAIAKNTLRQIVEQLATEYGTCLQWIRGYYIVGDDLRSNSVFCKVLQADQEGQKTFPFNSGKNQYDFMSIEELAEQIVAVAEQQTITGIINCCSGQPVALADKMESFIQEHGLSISLDYGAFRDRPYDSPAVWGDNKKIQLILKNKEN